MRIFEISWALLRRCANETNSNFMQCACWAVGKQNDNKMLVFIWKILGIWRCNKVASISPKFGKEDWHTWKKNCWNSILVEKLLQKLRKNLFYFNIQCCGIHSIQLIGTVLGTSNAMLIQFVATHLRFISWVYWVCNAMFVIRSENGIAWTLLWIHKRDEYEGLSSLWPEYAADTFIESNY